jgi:hypothetical protein
VLRKLLKTRAIHWITPEDAHHLPDLDTALQHKRCLHMGVVVDVESLVNLLHPRWKCPLILKRLSEGRFLLRQALSVMQATGMSSGLICMFPEPLSRNTETRRVQTNRNPMKGRTLVMDSFRPACPEDFPKEK